MAERDAVERLDAVVESVLAGRATASIDPDIAMLAAVAVDLRDLPDPNFKSRLRRELMPAVETRPVDATPQIGTIRPYLLVDDGDAMLRFLQDAFDAEVLGAYRRPNGTLMHGEVRIGDSILELAQANEQWEKVDMAIHLYVDNADAVLERAVRAGAKILRPIVDQFYGDREATIIDLSGNHWYIATHLATHGKRPGYGSITPFIHVRGTDRLIDFLKDALGAEEAYERYTTPEGLIAHAALRVGESLVEFGEGPGDWKPLNGHIHVFVKDPDALFERAVKAGAKVLYPMADQPYGERGGGVTDPFGNHWYIATPK